MDDLGQRLGLGGAAQSVAEVSRRLYVGHLQWCLGRGFSANKSLVVFELLRCAFRVTDTHETRVQGEGGGSMAGVADEMCVAERVAGCCVLLGRGGGTGPTTWSPRRGGCLWRRAASASRTRCALDGAASRGRCSAPPPRDGVAMARVGKRRSSS
jgi:hypothetical protein